MPWIRGERLWVRRGRTSGTVLVVRRHLGNAVCRNRVKRRLRHLCRELGLSDADRIVVLVQPEAVASSFQGLRDELTRLLAVLPADDPVAT